MDLTNEERTVLGQLRNRRFWCTAAAVAGAVLLLVAAAGQANGVGVALGLVLLVGGLIIRSLTVNRLRLVEARAADRVN